MSKSLIDEALADAKQLKELAYENAKRALVEQVTPRLKQLIEEEILNEGQSGDDADEDGDDAVRESDEEGTDESVSESSDFELNSESVSVMAPLLRATESTGDKVELKVYSLGESIFRACRLPAAKRTSNEVRKQISELFSRIEDTYSHVHEAKGIDAKRRERLEEKLESYYAELNEEFKEIGEMKKFKLNEADEMAPEAGAEAPADMGADPAQAPGGEDVVITLKGLKDVDAESLNVDVQVEEPGEEDAEGEADGDDDFLAGLGGDEGGEEPPALESAFESLGLSDDTILEIADEDLKREVARMQRMTESDSDAGKKMPKGGKIPVDDFGGGKDDGDPWLDHDVTTADDISESVDEDAVVEIAIDESDDEEVSEGSVDECDMEEGLQAESIKKIKAYKAAALKCRGTVRESRLKKAAMFEMKRIQESKARVAKLTESKKGTAKNAVSLKEVQELRSQLAEVNLFNAKLLYANKLLQTEGLTVAQRNKIIDALDATKSLKEAKMLYTKLAATLSSKGKKGTVTESARPAGRVTGSSSRVGQSSGAPLNESKSESVEVDRWATLAGIK